MTFRDISLATLKVDKDFIRRAKWMGLETLGDIMDIKLVTLRNNNYFNYIWYSTLLEILEKQGMLEEFQRRQL